MKILCVGCSWTEETGTTGEEETYPWLLRERFPRADVYNFGLRGANNVFINMILRMALRDIQPDYTIRQVTGFARGMAAPEAIPLKFKQVADRYWILDRAYYFHNIVFWTAANISHIGWEDVYSLKEKRAFFNNFIDGTHYEYKLRIDEGALLLSNHLLKDCAHTTMFWKDDREKLLSQELWHDAIAVETDIGFEHAIDEGAHFDRVGNTLVADMLQPRIEPYVYI